MVMIKDTAANQLRTCTATCTFGEVVSIHHGIIKQEKLIVAYTFPANLPTRKINE